MTPPDTPGGPHPLELSESAMRDMVGRALEKIVAHVGSLPTQPMHATAGGRRLARALQEPLPEHGTPFPKLLHLLFQRVIPRSLNTASPGYLAYVPGGGLFHAAVADLLANAVNRYVGVWMAAPGLVALEENTIQWLCQMCGLPPGCGGVLTSGGSHANLGALVAARHAWLPEDFLRGTLYVSDQVHHSITKAARVAGFPAHNVRVVPTDPTFRIRMEVLKEQVAQDRAHGCTPFLVVGNGGSTNTGAVDPLGDLADFCAEQRLWFHVDAAYGGAFVLTDRGRHVLHGMERADSITLDPHKGLFLPYGTGALLVRQRARLKSAHHMDAEYLPPMQEDDAHAVDYADLSAELSRDWRGLRLWLPLKMHGAQVFRDALNEKLDLAQHAHQAISKIPHVVVHAPPQLSLLAFRVEPAHLPPASWDAVTRQVLAAVNKRQRVLLNGTTVHGDFVIRVCVLSFRTHQQHVQHAVDDVAAAVREVVSPC